MLVGGEDTGAAMAGSIPAYVSRILDMGGFTGIAPTAKPVKQSAMSILRIELGKLTEQWILSNGRRANPMLLRELVLLTTARCVKKSLLP